MTTNEVQLIIEANRVTNAMIKEMYEAYKGLQDKVDKHEAVYQVGKWTLATALAGVLGWLGYK